MIALAQCHKGSDNVISGRVAVVKGLVAEPVSERVDTESRLLNEEDAKNTSIDETAHPVTPAITSDKHWEDQAHECNSLEIISVLPDDNRIIVEIRNIRPTDTLWVLLHDHPAEVGVEKTLANRVWVFVGICVSVMGTMISGPPSD